VYTYTLVLTLVLLGIVLGTRAARFFDQMRRRGLVLGALQIGSSLTVLSLLMLPAA